VKRKVALIDNGSLVPAAALELRRIAARLGTLIGETVDSVSMAHSSKIPKDALDGVAASLWRDYADRSILEGVEELIALPLFFGPSRAVKESLPKQFAASSHGKKDCVLRVGATLVQPMDSSDAGMARILADLIIKKLDTIDRCGNLPVVLVDHGSPSKEVGICRDLVAAQLRKILGERVESVTASSMERRGGEAYAFNEPTLEGVFNGGLVSESSSACLSMMFLLPGRHAGGAGDIDQIISASEWVKAGKRTFRTELVGRSDGLVNLLANRYATAQAIG